MGGCPSQAEASTSRGRLLFTRGVGCEFPLSPPRCQSTERRWTFPTASWRAEPSRSAPTALLATAGPAGTAASACSPGSTSSSACAGMATRVRQRPAGHASRPPLCGASFPLGSLRTSAPGVCLLGWAPPLPDAFPASAPPGVDRSPFAPPPLCPQENAARCQRSSASFGIPASMGAPARTQPVCVPRASRGSTVNTVSLRGMGSQSAKRPPVQASS